MKEVLFKLIKRDRWEKGDKLFVIAMMIMGVFNFSLVFFMLNR